MARAAGRRPRTFVRRRKMPGARLRAECPGEASLSETWPPAHSDRGCRSHQVHPGSAPSGSRYTGWPDRACPAGRVDHIVGGRDNVGQCSDTCDVIADSPERTHVGHCGRSSSGASGPHLPAIEILFVHGCQGIERASHGLQLQSSRAPAREGQARSASSTRPFHKHVLVWAPDCHSVSPAIRAQPSPIRTSPHAEPCSPTPRVRAGATAAAHALARDAADGLSDRAAYTSPGKQHGQTRSRFHKRPTVAHTYVCINKLPQILGGQLADRSSSAFWTC